MFEKINNQELLVARLMACDDEEFAPLDAEYRRRGLARVFTWRGIEARCGDMFARGVRVACDTPQRLSEMAKALGIERETLDAALAMSGRQWLTPQGKLPKRLRKALAKLGVNTSPEAWRTLLGDEAKAVFAPSAEVDVVDIEIVDHMSWTRGTWGEPASHCWWTGYRSGRAAMFYAQMWALRMRDAAGVPFGHVLAWRVDDSQLGLVNAYTRTNDVSTRACAYMLARHFDLEVTEISTRLGERIMRHVVYINDSTMFVLADKGAQVDAGEIRWSIYESLQTEDID